MVYTYCRSMYDKGDHKMKTNNDSFYLIEI